MPHNQDEQRESIEEATPEKTLNFRQAMLSSVDELLRYGKLFQEEKKNPQMTMFDNEIKKPVLPQYDLSEEQLMHLARKEKEIVGMYLTYNPLDKYILVRLGCVTTTWEQLKHNEQNAIGFIIDYIEDAPFNKGRYELQLENGGLIFEYKIKGLDQYKHSICLFRAEWDCTTKRVKILKVRRCMELEQEWKGLFTNITIRCSHKDINRAFEYYKRQDAKIHGEHEMSVTFLVVLKNGDILEKKLSPKNFTKEDLMYYDRLGDVCLNR